MASVIQISDFFFLSKEAILYQSFSLSDILQYLIMIVVTIHLFWGVVYMKSTAIFSLGNNYFS